MEPKLNQETNITPMTSRRKKVEHSREVTHHLWSFIVSIALTALAFLAVGFGVIENTIFLGMFLLLLAAIQAVFQLFVWMHLNQKGHEIPIWFIFSGILFMIVIVAGLMLMLWW